MPQDASQAAMTRTTSEARRMQMKVDQQAVCGFDSTSGITFTDAEWGCIVREWIRKGRKCLSEDEVVSLLRTIRAKRATRQSDPAYRSGC